MRRATTAQTNLFEQAPARLLEEPVVGAALCERCGHAVRQRATSDAQLALTSAEAAQLTLAGAAVPVAEKRSGRRAKRVRDEAEGARVATPVRYAPCGGCKRTIAVGLRCAWCRRQSQKPE